MKNNEVPLWLRYALTCQKRRSILTLAKESCSRSPTKTEIPDL